MFQPNEFYWGKKKSENSMSISPLVNNNELIVNKSQEDVTIYIPEDDYSVDKLANAINGEFVNNNINCEVLIGYVKIGGVRGTERIVFNIEDEEVITFSGSLIDYLEGFDFIKMSSDDYSSSQSAPLKIRVKLKKDAKEVNIRKEGKQWWLTQSDNPLVWNVSVIEDGVSTPLPDINQVGYSVVLEENVEGDGVVHKYDIEQYDEYTNTILLTKDMQFSYNPMGVAIVTPPPTGGSGGSGGDTGGGSGGGSTGSGGSGGSDAGLKVPIPSVTNEYTLDLGFNLGTPSSSNKLTSNTSYNYYEISDVLSRGTIKELVYGDTASKLYRMKFVVKNRNNYVLWTSIDVTKTSEGFVLRNLNIDIDEPFVLGVLFVVDDGVSKMADVNAHNSSGASYKAYPVSYGNVVRNAWIDPTTSTTITGKKLPVKIKMGDRTYLRRTSYSISQTIEGTPIADSNVSDAKYAFYGGKMPETMNYKWTSNKFFSSVRDRWIGYNFSTNKHIRKIKMWCGWGMPNLLVQRSDDGANWIDVKEFININGATSTSSVYDDGFWVDLDLPISAPTKMWRILNTTTGSFNVWRMEMLEAPIDYGDSSFDIDYGHSVGFAPAKVDLLPSGKNILILDDVITKGTIVDVKLKNYEQKLSYVYFFAVDEYFQVRWTSSKVNRVGQDINLTNVNAQINHDFRLGVYVPETGKNLKYYQTGEKDIYWNTDYYYPNYYYGTVSDLSGLDYGDVPSLAIATHLKLKQSALPIKVRMK